MWHYKVETLLIMENIKQIVMKSVGMYEKNGEYTNCETYSIIENWQTMFTKKLKKKIKGNVLGNLGAAQR